MQGEHNVATNAPPWEADIAHYNNKTAAGNEHTEDMGPDFVQFS